MWWQKHKIIAKYIFYFFSVNVWWLTLARILSYDILNYTYVVYYKGETEDTNDASLRGNKKQPNILLNSDFCLMWNFTVDDSGNAMCTVRPKNPGARGNCERSTTAAKLEHYSKNNADWVSDFTNVFMKMISRNGENTDLKLISELDD